MTKVTVQMKINSEKKHSVRYDAVEADSAVTSVYVMKTSLPSKTPQTITLTIEME